ncbi:hypothetical protein PUMCH_004251 [Australozyma saopauloensis]|uniref:P-loop containing nucleoside triphosphate hydrolase protein n=1 Tax=Australozyma saopauloensis TaxID=291208 RepID=A0AAX4HEH0_9ASCO|nr:hypothetical protein PUMCH_004251 [[Candida] saopauloensis]
MEQDPAPAATAFDVATQFVDREIQNWKGPHALVIGISGPQGSGKSFLTAKILDHLRHSKPTLNCVGLLLDDFYLTHKDQVAVTKAAQLSENALLQGRGLPGTHDLELAVETLHKLRNGTVPVGIPFYDKSAFNGEGDRLDLWGAVDKTVDVVLFEGWMNGFKAIDPTLFPAAYMCTGTESVVQKTHMYHLEEINADLGRYEPLWGLFDRFVYLKTDVEKNVYKWRLQQEADLISKRGTGMTDAQVVQFVDRYMPMYVLYYWRMCAEGAAKGKDCNLCIEINGDRNVEGHFYF